MANTLGRDLHGVVVVLDPMIYDAAPGGDTRFLCVWGFGCSAGEPDARGNRWGGQMIAGRFVSDGEFAKVSCDEVLRVCEDQTIPAVLDSDRARALLEREGRKQIAEKRAKEGA